MNLTPEEKFIRNIWALLKEIKEESLHMKAGKSVSISLLVGTERLLEKLEEWGVLRILKMQKGSFDLMKSIRNTFYLAIDWKKFNELYSLCKLGFETGIEPEELFKIVEKHIHPTGKDDELSFEIRQLLNSEKKIIKTDVEAHFEEKMPDTFCIEVKDRYIWVNNYLLSKPHAVGNNLEFFEYVRSRPVNTKIERKSLPSQFGSLSLSEQIKNKSFVKILNELGFKGEILKAYFPKRGKNIVVYRGDEITKKDLEKSGINIKLFLKELELAHLKNSPE